MSAEYTISMLGLYFNLKYTINNLVNNQAHIYFRFREPDQPKNASLMPRFGSRFRYSGRTQFQTRQLVTEEGRDAPFFDRVLSKRGTFAGRTQNMKKRDDGKHFNFLTGLLNLL